MNVVVLCGRLTAEPRVNDKGTMASFNLAVDRTFKDKDGNKQADFISCKMLGEKSAGFAKNYLHKGTKLIVTGAIQTGSYTDKDGKKVYTTDVIVNNTEFAESRSSQQSEQKPAQTASSGDGFMNIPAGIDEELPFA
jgi:single-strand DNA-binding protein